MADNYYPHIILKTLPEISDFTSYRQGRSTENIPQRNRQKQSQRLLAKLEEDFRPGFELEVIFMKITSKMKEKIGEVAKKHGVKKAYSFGSFVREEGRNDSDLDVLVE